MHEPLGGGHRSPSTARKDADGIHLCDRSTALDVTRPFAGLEVSTGGWDWIGPLPTVWLWWDHDVVSERDEFITWVQSDLVDAEVAVHNGDVGPRRALWSRNDPVTVLGAWKNAFGQRELDELFGQLAESFSDCTSYEFELLEAEVLGDTAYTVGLEHTSASVDGVPRTYTLRATQIYRREEGAWKVAHRHGSAPPE